MNELLRYWYDVLKSDLEGFADRGSPIVIEEGPRKLVGSWVQRARPRREEFRLSPEDDFRWVRAAPSPMASYRDFLLSEQMADFGQLATAIVQAFPKSPNYVPTTADVEEGPTGESDKVLKERVRSALEGANGETQLLFVKGEA